VRKLLPILALLGGMCFGNTPPTLSANVGLANATTTPRSTASVSWVTGDIIVVTMTDEGVNTGDGFTAVPTATGLTFASVINHTASANCALAIFTATAASSGSSAITGSHHNSGTAGNWVMWVWVWHNSGGVGTNASQFTSTKTVNLTPAGGANSAIVWAVGDFAGGSVTPSATPTSPNETTRQAIGAAGANYLNADITNQTSSGAVSYGIVTTTTGPFSIGVLEIKGTTGGGPTCSQSISLMGVGCQ